MKLKRFALGTLWTNCYVITDKNNTGFIVDPGGPALEVAEYIQANGIKIEWIILTHGHSDHLGGIDDVRSLSANGLAIGEYDAECLTNPCCNLSAYMGDEISFKEAERLLRDGDKLQIGSMTLDIIHTPGHTAGGICILVSCEDEKIILSGDTLFYRSIGRTDLHGGSDDALMESLKKLYDTCTADVRTNDIQVYPGHGQETFIGAEKLYNPYWPR